MARVELSDAAVADVDRLALTLSLPGDTRERLKRSLRPLERFPLLGIELTGRWSGLRLLLGPWSWMLVVHLFDESDDRVVAVTIQDARSSGAATSSGR